MTTKLDLPDDLVEDLHLLAARDGRRLDQLIVELLRVGLATSPSREAAEPLAPAAMLEARHRIADKFLSGEWGVELAGFSEGRMADRERAAMREQAWRR
jgi:hypothetical protein